MAGDYRKQLREFQKSLEIALEFQTTNAGLAEINKFVTTVIRDRTQAGYGIGRSGGPKVALKPLKTSTIAARKRKKKKGLLSSKTSPSKSNLTDTGQMLAALQGRAINGLVEFTFADKKRKGGDDVTNEDVAAYQKKKGRKFLGLTAEDIKALTVLLENQLIKTLDRTFKK